MGEVPLYPPLSVLSLERSQRGRRERVEAEPCFRVEGLGSTVQGLRFRVQGSRFRVEGLGFRVWGSGLRV